MPAIPPALAAFFTPQVRTRGERYHREGRVRLKHASPTHVEAVVRGSRPYTVTFEVRDDLVATSCTCPYATDFDTGCKHVWAALLAAADEGNVLETRESLVHGPPAVTRDHGPDRHVARERERHREPERHQPRDHHPRWRRELDRIRT
jgi:uncharacterized Zn finger protein